MTNGLVKGRMTYFHENGTVYQAFNTFAAAKVTVYVCIPPNQYKCCSEFQIDHRIDDEELKLIATENELLNELNQMLGE